MASNIDLREVADLVKSRTDIVKVIGERLTLDSHLKAICPFHDDGANPSFSVNRKNQYFKCFGCDVGGDVIRFVELFDHKSFGEALRDLAAQVGIEVPNNNVTPILRSRKQSDVLPEDKPPMSQPVSSVTVLQLSTGLTLEALAGAKKLAITFLGQLGVSNTICNRLPAVSIPYFNEKREIIAIRRRLSLNTEPRFMWRKNDHVHLYGLDRLPQARNMGWALLVEGESDCWTGWHYDLPVFGLPGKTTWQSEWAHYFKDIELYVWEEPDADIMVERLAHDFPNLHVIVAPDGIKDLSEAHIQGQDVPALIERLKAQSALASDVLRQQRESNLIELRVGLRGQASPVLSSDDPLDLVEDAIEVMGYGGKVDPVLITYIAATSRLLGMRRGAMPDHLLLIGPPSAGKSFCLQTALQLLPPEAYHTIDAGSPSVLIYDDAELSHRVVVFSEADSLPAGEDNPAASAVRNLLADHFLHYKVTVRDPDTGNFTVREVCKDGPSVLMTTSTRRLGHQLGTRLFELEVPDDQTQIRAGLDAQARAEIYGVSGPSEALVAYQALLQTDAPWDVLVPFADKLARYIGQSPSDSRVQRDYARLLSLIKSVAVLRHMHRQTNKDGRLVATIEDYETIYKLVGEMYSGSVTGASANVRVVVRAVKELRSAVPEPAQVTNTLIATYLKINKMTVSRCTRTAEDGGWLVNKVSGEAGKRKKDWEVGETLPAEAGLPQPSELGSLEVEEPSSNSVTVQTVRNNGHGQYEAEKGALVPISSVAGGGVNGKNGHTTEYPSGNSVTPLQTGLAMPTRAGSRDRTGWVAIPGNQPTSAGPYHYDPATGQHYRLPPEEESDDLPF